MRDPHTRRPTQTPDTDTPSHQNQHPTLVHMDSHMHTQTQWTKGQSGHGYAWLHMRHTFSWILAQAHVMVKVPASHADSQRHCHSGTSVCIRLTHQSTGRLLGSVWATSCVCVRMCDACVRWGGVYPAGVHAHVHTSPHMVNACVGCVEGAPSAHAQGLWAEAVAEGLSGQTQDKGPL